MLCLAGTPVLTPRVEEPRPDLLGRGQYQRISVPHGNVSSEFRVANAKIKIPRMHINVNSMDHLFPTFILSLQLVLNHGGRGLSELTN
eukprot:4573076-Pyramimonas_sp.AAC.1